MSDTLKFKVREVCFLSIRSSRYQMIGIPTKEMKSFVNIPGMRQDQTQVVATHGQSGKTESHLERWECVNSHPSCNNGIESIQKFWRRTTSLTPMCELCVNSKSLQILSEVYPTNMDFIGADLHLEADLYTGLDRCYVTDIKNPWALAQGRWFVGQGTGAKLGSSKEMAHQEPFRKRSGLLWVNF